MPPHDYSINNNFITGNNRNDFQVNGSTSTSTTIANLKDFCQHIPKAELHVHIEGTLEPELLFALAQRNKIELPSKFHSIEALQQAYNEFSNLQDFLDLYYQGAAVLQRPEDFEQLMFAYLQRAHKDGVVRTEIFFDPQTHTARGVGFEVFVPGFAKAMARAEAELGISVALIMCFLRHLPPADALQTWYQAQPYVEDGSIIGVGLDSSEFNYPPELFQEVFDLAREAGLKRVAHAGEEGPPAYIISALDNLQVDRVDHGVRSEEDPDLVQRLVDTQMPLTVCPFSNLQLKVIDELAKANLKRLLDRGVAVTINSDDPAYFGGYIAENYCATAEAIGLTLRDIVTIAKTSLEATFASAEQKQIWLDQVDTFVEQVNLQGHLQVRSNISERQTSINETFESIVPKTLEINSAVIYEEEPSVLAPAAIVCTPYSTGCCIAKEIKERGYKVFCLWSAGLSEQMKAHIPKSATGLKWDLVLEEQKTLDSTANLVLSKAAECGLQIVACICGGDNGVDLADSLSERLGLLSNGTAVANRRDKKVQQELIKDAGLRSIRQISCQSLTQEVKEFLNKESKPVVVKPLDSAGSDGVKLCRTVKEAKSHILYLLNDHELVCGGKCEDVLIQEFLQGDEYVVDQVSRDGNHKTVMLWKYDKRPANGSQFVYFGDLAVDSESEQAHVLIPYARAVLDALGVKNGPSHGEIILTANGPCLVEMNCRAHGANGIWQPLCRALTGGYSQIEATVDSYLDKSKFDQLPDKPCSPYKASGNTVELVSYRSGVVKSTPGYNIIRLLPSFVNLETGIQEGSLIEKTVDLLTAAGTVLLMNTDKSALERDIQLIRSMESAGVLFEFETKNNENDEAVFDNAETITTRDARHVRAVSVGKEREFPTWSVMTRSDIDAVAC